MALQPQAPVAATTQQPLIDPQPAAPAAPNAPGAAPVAAGSGRTALLPNAQGNALAQPPAGAPANTAIPGLNQLSSFLNLFGNMNAGLPAGGTLGEILAGLQQQLQAPPSFTPAPIQAALPPPPVAPAAPVAGPGQVTIPTNMGLTDQVNSPLFGQQFASPLEIQAAQKAIFGNQE